MPELTLPSLQIEGYRLFESLTIPRLGRVYLITGKNNVGKSSVLEALRIYADRGAPRTLLEILADRDEMPSISSVAEMDVTLIGECLGNLMYGRPSPPGSQSPIRLGSTGAADNALTLSVEWYTPGAPDANARAAPQKPDIAIGLTTGEIRPSLVVTMGERSGRLWLAEFHQYARGAQLVPNLERLGRIPTVVVPPRGLNSSESAYRWDQIALTSFEDEVIAALQAVAPGVHRISLVASPPAGLGGAATTPPPPSITGNSSPHPARRSFRVKMNGAISPVPARSLGDGVNRVLGMSLALVSAQGGFLLLDEVENGIHYTVQADLWRHVFRMACQLNVQVFATTHSYDCVLAFQEAAAENAEVEGALIRLQRAGDRIRVDAFDEESLSTVAREQIEVR